MSVMFLYCLSFQLLMMLFPSPEQSHVQRLCDVPSCQGPAQELCFALTGFSLSPCPPMWLTGHWGGKQPLPHVCLPLVFRWPFMGLFSNLNAFVMSSLILVKV